jgi:hypothetical protein
LKRKEGKKKRERRKERKKENLMRKSTNKMQDMITPKGLALKYLPKIKQLDCLGFY